MGKVRINLELMENMNYYWNATSEKEKVGEAYLNTIASNENLKVLYTEEFTQESIRKVLSAISNREVLKGTKTEMRFWNNNMWMLEDLEIMNQMLSPLKRLNLEGLEVKKDQEVVVVPGHYDLSYREEGKLYLNFFKVKVDLYEEGKVTIEDKDLMTWFKEELEKK